MADESRESREPRTPLWAAAAVAVLAGVLYANTLANGFAYDDRLLIERNTAVQGEGGLAALWLASYHAGYGGLQTGLYRPLTLTSFRLNYLAGGLDPRGYHALNVALHAVVSMLVFVLARRLSFAGPAALAAAVLFAAHPIHTEAVANLAGRAELLAALFAVGAFLGHARREASWRMSAVAGTLWFLALMSKENAVTLLAPLLVWEAWRWREAPQRPVPNAWREVAVRWAPLIAAVGTYFALRAAVLGAPWAGPETITRVENPLVGEPWPVRAATAAYVAVRYWSLFCWPATLSPDYSYAAIVPVGPSDPRGAGSLLLVLAVGALWIWGARRRRELLWAGVWYAAPYALVANVFVLIGTIMGERLLYLPSVGLCLLAGFAFAQGWRVRRAAPIVAAAGGLLLAAASWRTVERNRDWRDNYTLFSRALEAVPQSVKVLTNLGAELIRRGRVEQARVLLERAVSLAPEHTPARLNLLQCMLVSGELERAEAEARAILREEPRHALARLHLAQVLRQRGAVEEAARLLEGLMADVPGRPELWREWAWVERARGNAGEAERAFQKALRLAPDSVMLHNDLALFYLEQGRPREAVPHLRRAVELEPDSVPLRNNLGRALREAGELEASRQALEEALSLDPDLAATHYNLALTLRAAGRLEEARRHYERATALLGRSEGAAQGDGR